MCRPNKCHDSPPPEKGLVQFDPGRPAQSALQNVVFRSSGRCRPIEAFPACLGAALICHVRRGIVLKQQLHVRATERWRKRVTLISLDRDSEWNLTRCPDRMRVITWFVQ